ncbi:MAG: zinc metallopeptidase [Bacteroidia bacterium]|nr:zinc metallopeptidase [Bacteroidia bacterium]
MIYGYGIYIISVVFLIIGSIVQARLKSRFKKYSQTRLSSDLSGREVAEKMLRESGIYDVQVTAVQGQLTDHYNPINKTVNLSEAVYHQRNAAAAAVAAHECGHAVQHARSYPWLTMRSKITPVVHLSSRWMHWVLLAGIVLVNQFPPLLLGGIVLFAMTTLFSFITLPVEFDASKRALEWMKTSNVATESELTMSKDALKWAALTYVVAAMSSLATLLYYVMIYMNRR